MAIAQVEYPLVSNGTMSSLQPLTPTSPPKQTFEDHPEHSEMYILVHTN